MSVRPAARPAGRPLGGAPAPCRLQHVLAVGAQRLSAGALPVGALPVGALSAQQKELALAILRERGGDLEDARAAPPGCG